MALRKDDLYASYDKGKQAMKRSRITIDVSPELRKRIKKAASEQDVSISKFLTQIIEDAVPSSSGTVGYQGHPVTREAIERLRQVRERILQDRGGKPFENTNELIWQMREERSRELEQL
jgi:hypothetical protein